MKRVYDEELKCHFLENDSVSDCLGKIWIVGHDYDGYETVEGLKSLIDELVGWANDARKFLDEGKYYSKEFPAPETQTNFNHIKNMTIDEMAEYFGVDRRPHFPSSPCYVCEYEDGLMCVKPDECTDEYKKEVYKKWLEKEIEE